MGEKVCARLELYAVECWTAETPTAQLIEETTQDGRVNAHGPAPDLSCCAP